MQLAKNFFSFARLLDPAFHHAYNEWHHLDHRPEILALPGMHWGERWVLTPQCAALAHAPGEQFGSFDYLTMYWLREPLQPNLDAFLKLSLDCFHWGRHPEIEQVARPYMGWADPVRGYAARRVMMAPHIIPIRPHRGIHLTVSRLSGSIGDANAILHWHNQTAVPALTDIDGVVGAWTFVETDGPTSHANWTQNLAALRFRILWLDEDPVEWTRAHAAKAMRAAPVEGAQEELLFSGPLRVIRAFEYDWFDTETSEELE